MHKCYSYIKSWAVPLAYTSPIVGIGCLVAPLAVVQGIYAKYYGVPLTAIAMVILVARFFDAITDPAIGYFADRYYQKTGSRKPFVMAGGLLTVVSGCFLYMPPDKVSTAYFAISLVLFYLAYTLFNIPHLTWGGELSSSEATVHDKVRADKATDKTKVYTLHVMCGYLGMILFYTIPQLPLFESSDITPETLRVTAVVAGLLVVGSLWICGAGTPGTSLPSIAPANVNHPARDNRSAIFVGAATRNEFHLLLRMMTGNAPFILFCAAVVCSGIAAGMWYGLIFIYVDAYLGMGDQFAQMFMMAFMVGVISAPFWYRVVRHIGKKNVWIVAKLLMMVCFVYTTQLHPGETQFYQLVLLKTLQTFSLAGAGIVTVTLLSDIADYGAWKYRVNRSSSYFAIYTFITKSNVAVAMALGLAVAGWYGFDAAATAHSQASVFGLTLAMTWLPLFFSTVSLIFFLMMPLDERRIQIVRRRLECRKARAAARMAETSTTEMTSEKTPETSSGATSFVTATTTPSRS